MRDKKAGSKKAFILICTVLILLAAFTCFPVLLRAEDSLVIFSGIKGQKRIALTFDDGPHETKTAEILDLLKEYGVQATFFVIGSNAKEHPELIRRELGEGHEVGNHTYRHTILSKSTAEQTSDELRQTEEVLLSAARFAPTLFRPPGGVYTKEVMKAASLLGYRIILWNVDTRDWAGTDVQTMVSNVKQNAKDGSIILFHDYTGCRAHTLEALKILIPSLLEEGYEFVTVSVLLGEAEE